MQRLSVSYVVGYDEDRESDAFESRWDFTLGEMSVSSTV